MCGLGAGALEPASAQMYCDANSPSYYGEREMKKPIHRTRHFLLGKCAWESTLLAKEKGKWNDWRIVIPSLCGC